MIRSIAIQTFLIALGVFALCIAVAPAARADCANPTRTEGAIIYNTDFKTMQFCDGTDWWDMKGGGGGGGLPTCPVLGDQVVWAGDQWVCLSTADACDVIAKSPLLDPPPAGTVCADGAIYIGKTDLVDASTVAVFAAPDDEGQFQWKVSATSTAGAVDSTTDGLANTDAIEAAGLSDHPAAEACRDRGPEWYLPSINELILMQGPSGVIGAVADEYYWASAQSTITSSARRRIIAGSTGSSTTSKTTSHYVRCVRQ